ncbi:MAG: hypothetical protein KAH22_11150 [Thiotrichaceae bacterium]|nr:hypothetical protein [Thiotrichaceae bacterium]
MMFRLIFLLILFCFNLPLQANPANKTLFTLDIIQLKNSLDSAPELSAKESDTLPTIQLPLPNGEFITFLVEETHILAPLLAQKYPEIQTYKIKQKGNTGVIGRLSLSTRGLLAIFHSKEARKISITPINKDNINNQQYISEWSNEVSGKLQHKRSNDQLPQAIEETFYHLAQKQKGSTSLTQYRVAIAANSGFVAAQGGTVSSALADIAHIINSVNAVFERDLGIQLTLIKDNDKIIFDRANNDPYSGELSDMAYKNQEVIDDVIGAENYDIGHLFVARGGGVAHVQSSCKNGSKATAVSGKNKLSLENFATEYVAHEMGHQFGATHTFSSNKGLCTNDAFTAGSAYEPGSGASIMSYAGLCGSDNLQSHSDKMFHIGSIEQIRQFKQKISTCGIDISHKNANTAVIDAGYDYTIPINTAFELKAEISSKNDFTSYNWQQLDTNSTVTTLGSDMGNNALFRSFLPQQSTTQSFPKITRFLAGKTTLAEQLPKKQREMNFRFIANLKYGGSLIDHIKLNISDTGAAFKIKTVSTNYQAGNDLDITWEVADTDLSPINCSTIDISLTESRSQPIFKTLANNITNNGSARITLNQSYHSNSVVKIKCSDNIFYALSYQPKNIPQAATSNTVNTQNNMNDTKSNGEEEAGGAGGVLPPYLLLLFGLLFFPCIKSER